jgi:Antitoxin Xre/MbcA/ParS C-terminal toxin-binding domain
MKTLPTRQPRQPTVLAQERDLGTSGKSAGRPKLFADTEYTARLFNKHSGRLDIRSVADLYNLSVSELARMINVEVKTAHKTPDSIVIHESLIPFEEMARTLALTKGNVSDFRRWLNASNTELGNRTPLQMIRERQVRELAGIVRSALLGQPD